MKPRCSRRAAFGAFSAVFSVALLLGSSGCGGGNKNKEATADTGTKSGSLLTVQMTPYPGSAFISRTTTFRLAWTNDNPPPPSFSAALIRYKENGGSPISDTQSTTLTRQGDSYTWDLKRSSNFDLEAPAVYIVELNSGPEQIRTVYIVSSDRAAPTTASSDAGRAALQATPPLSNPTGEGDALVHEVSVGTTR